MSDANERTNTNHGPVNRGHCDHCEKVEPLEECLDRDYLLVPAEILPLPKDDQ